MNEGNIFDKILRENAGNILIGLIGPHLAAKISEAKPLPEKLHSTLAREVDALFDVHLENGRRLLIHIEFQTKSQADMIYRYAEYHGMLVKKYQMEIRHFLIYLGQSFPNMPDVLPEEQVFRGFMLFDIGRIDPAKMLSSQIPEVLMLGLLADYPEEQRETIVRSIIENLMKASPDPILFRKYIVQLLIFAKLRKAQPVTLNVLQTMPVTFDIKDFAIEDIENDVFYLRGLEQKTIDIILSGHRNGLAPGMLATLTGWTEEKVLEVIREKG